MAVALQQKPEIKIKLSAVAGPHSGQVFQLSKATFTIGRGPENDVVLLNDPQASRLHAKVSVIEQDLEISNLSKKNSIIVQGESVQKWKIVNNSKFTIGDTEFSVEYDLGHAVVSIPTKKPVTPKAQAPVKAPAKPLLNLVALKNSITQPTAPHSKPKAPQAVAKFSRPLTPATKNQQSLSSPQLKAQNQVMSPRPAPRPMVSTNANAAASSKSSDSLAKNPKLKFYLILVIVIIGAYVSLLKTNQSAKTKKIASTLIYGDEIMAKVNSQKEKELSEQRDAQKKINDSTQRVRIEENFVKGMRDFQLGNYARAQEFFQLVLNLDSEHPLAKRYLYLCKVRFDEVVQEKLMLGESYFKKHNFRMCESLYRQVMDMLNGKSNDQKYQLAEKKAKECEYASEGIR